MSRAWHLAALLLACRPVGHGDTAPPGPAQCLAAHDEDRGIILDTRPGEGDMAGVSVGWLSKRVPLPVTITLADRQGRSVRATTLQGGISRVDWPDLTPGDYTVTATIAPRSESVQFALQPDALIHVWVSAFSPGRPEHRPGLPTLPSRVLLEYDQSLCHGRCPAFRVVVLRDGRVHWYGGKFSAARGPRFARLDPAALAALEGWLACFAVLPSYYNMGLSGPPEVELRFRSGERIHRFNVNDRDVPDVIYAYLNALRHTLGLARWIEG